MTTTKKTTHNQALDSLKFIFSVIIVYYHLLHSNMEGCIGGTELYKVLSHACDGSGLWKWGKVYWMNEPVLAVAVSTLIAVVIGIITYYLVEQPCANWYKRRKMNRA